MASAERAPELEPPVSQRVPAGRATLLELEARHYDPRSSRPTHVRLLVDDAMRVIVTGAGVDVECFAMDLRFGAPVLGRTLDAVLLPSGASCESEDKVALERLRQLAGRPRPFERIYRAEQSWAIAILATTVVAGLLLASYLWLIPLGALRFARAWPSLGQRIGHGTLALLDVALAPSELHPSERERLRGVFARVAADHPGLGLELEFRKAGFANAFALPDGTLVLTDELVRLAENDDELMGVLFHEAGHVAHGHALRRVVESSVFAMVAMAYYGDADQVTAVAGGLPLVYAKSRYSREEELEADDAALTGMRRHDRELRHYARILRGLEAARTSGRELEYFSSHPATEQRVRRFE